MIDYAFILTKYYPNKQWSLNGTSYEGLEWLDDSPKPTQQELDAAHTELMLENESVQYRNERAAAYNERGADLLSVVEALRESLAENRPEKLQAIQNIINEVKLEFPKPSEE